MHPFDDWNVIAGQGTAALELFEDVPSLDAVVTPIGGGGLLSGTALVNVFSEPVTLASVTVFDPAGKELMRIEGAPLRPRPRPSSRRQQHQSFPHRPPSRLTSI